MLSPNEKLAPGEGKSECCVAFQLKSGEVHKKRHCPLLVVPVSWGKHGNTI